MRLGLNKIWTFLIYSKHINITQKQPSFFGIYIFGRPFSPLSIHLGNIGRSSEITGHCNVAAQKKDIHNSLTLCLKKLLLFPSFTFLKSAEIHSHQTLKNQYLRARYVDVSWASGRLILRFTQPT
ncbi:hypothetical protein B0O79_4032 [Flavobacteriaceae bacterium MAR_2009_75]|nr:hypothetical protein B0O79_4032 [Flavobacteriaceae bacterium MAR_2009_75]